MGRVFDIGGGRAEFENIIGYDTGADFGGDLAGDGGVDLNTETVENTGDVNTNTENTSEISGEDLNKPETGYHTTEDGNRIYSDGSEAPNWGYEGNTGHLEIRPAGSELSILHEPGKPLGTFAAPVGTPFGDRGLPGNESDYEESIITTTRDQMVWAGTTAAANGQEGGGTQYMTLGQEHPWQDYLDNGLATQKPQDENNR
ncbi:MAG: TNT domain-containing protein [Planctomycetaceae bacterium]|jgi:hypothetical protein|nr:TNT domain-containing protein [Planctomycetaceae bacterium]